MKALGSFEMLGTARPVMRRRIPEDMALQQHRGKEAKSQLKQAQ